MAETLNISLSAGQLAWIKSRKAEGGYASASDFIRDLIRREQEKEWTALRAGFERMSRDGAPGPEPVEQIMAVVRKVKASRMDQGRLATDPGPACACDG